MRRETPPPIEGGWPELQLQAGAFVTLRIGGKLRGCIGQTSSLRPLVETVAEMAIAASTRDPRFSSLRVEELDAVRIEISVLGPLEPCSSEEVVLGRDGLCIEHGRSRGLLLPEVPVAAGWTRDQFLEGLCRKAGLSRDVLQHGAHLQRFETLHFEEEG